MTRGTLRSREAGRLQLRKLLRSLTAPGDLARSAATRAKARLCLLDTIGNMVAASGLPEAAAVRRAEGPLPEGAATVVGWSQPTSPLRAAFHNGVHSDLLEAQDGHRYAGLHPCEATIPAALAVAETTGARYGELIDAIVAGYETTVRFGETLFPEQTQNGFYPDGTCGPPGGAVAASRLLGSDLDTTEAAVSAALFMAPLSLIQNLRDAVKPLSAGSAAELALRAAFWAREGLGAGPGSLLEPNGFLQQLSAHPHLGRLRRPVDGSWAIDEVYFKPYPGGRHAHAPVDAVREILGDRPTDPRTIEEVEVATYRAAIALTGSAPTRSSPLAELTQSTRYAIAAGICDGTTGPERFELRRRHDPALLALSRRIRLVEDPAATRRYPEETLATVTLRFRRGRAERAIVRHRWGDPERPMSVEEVRAKFLRSLGGRSGAEAVWESWWSAPKDADVRDLLAPLPRTLARAAR